METKGIPMRVSPEATEGYEAAPAEQQHKIDALLSRKRAETLRAKRPLEVIISEMSRTAQKRGMTPDVLESILDEQSCG